MRARNRHPNHLPGLRNVRKFVLFLLFPLIFLTITLSTVYFVSVDIESQSSKGHAASLEMHNRLGISKIFQQRNDSQRRADEFNWNNRVYCMVPTLYNGHQVNLMTAIIGGWGAYCDVLKFFVDPGKDVPKTVRDPVTGKSADVVVVPMVRKTGGKCGDGNPCRHIWEKVWRSWMYVRENDIQKAEWFLKIDDDSYFIPSNLRKYVREQRWKPDDAHYFGHIVWPTADTTIISGVCSAFSRQSIIKMTEQYKTMPSEYGDRKNFKSHGQCVDRDGATEERVTARCLRDAGVYAEETIDDQNREFVLPLGIPFTVTYKRKPTSTSWYWRHKPQSRGDEERCCSPHAWGIHGYKSSMRMRRMTDLLYNFKLSKVEALLKQESPGSEQWWHLWYILRLREGLREDMYFNLWRPKPASAEIGAEA